MVTNRQYDEEVDISSSESVEEADVAPVPAPKPAKPAPQTMKSGSATSGSGGSASDAGGSSAGEPYSMSPASKLNPKSTHIKP